MDDFTTKKRDMVKYLKYEPDQTNPLRRLEKRDFVIMFIMTVITAIISFSFLGNRYSPQTLWVEDNFGSVTIELEKDMYVEKMQYFVGISGDKSFYINTSMDGTLWAEGPEVKTHSVFSWQDVSIAQWARYIKIVPLDADLSLFEVGFRDVNGEYISSASSDAPFLTDEQWLIPEQATYMNGTYFDEIYHARTAYEMINGIRIYENTHPPLGKAFIALGIQLFGMTPFGWRFSGVVFGVLLVPLIYLFAYRMFSRRKWAIFAALLMMFDFMRYSQSRIATIDTHVTFFIVLMYYYMYKYYRMSFYDTPLKKTFVPLFFSGLFMGVSIACKWPGVYAGAGLGVIFFHILYKRYMEYRYAAYHTDNTEKYDKFFKHAKATCLFCVFAFVILPLSIYGASYLTYFRAPDYNGIADIIANQQSMFSYHSELTTDHPYGSPWWQWPFIIRPVFFYTATINGLKAGISTFGNPAIWWLGIVAFFAVFNSGFAKGNKNARFLIIGYFAQYLPWCLIMRTTYIYHYFPSVPFVVLMITFMFKRYIDPKFKEAAILYPMVAFTLFVIFYAVLTGIPVPMWYINLIRWLPGWQLTI